MWLLILELDSCTFMHVQEEAFVRVPGDVCPGIYSLSSLFSESDEKKTKAYLFFLI